MSTPGVDGPGRLDASRPGYVSLLWVLLVAFGVFNAIRGVINVYQSSLPAELWLLNAGSLVSILFISFLWVLAGLAILRGRRWGWWLAGVVLVAGLIGALLGLLQSALMDINGEPLWRSRPDLIYLSIARIILNLGLFLLLFTGQVRTYLGTASVSAKKSMGTLLGRGFLLFVFQNLVLIFPSWLNGIVMGWS